MPTVMRRLLRLPTPSPVELEDWPVREGQPAPPAPVTLVSHEAARLDRVFPGWENHINKRKLNLGSSDRCVLGQLYGDFDRGLTAMLAMGEYAALDITRYVPIVGAERAWKKEIDYRRSL